jgi:hypothetical protein
VVPYSRSGLLIRHAMAVLSTTVSDGQSRTLPATWTRRSAPMIMVCGQPSKLDMNVLAASLLDIWRVRTIFNSEGY